MGFIEIKLWNWISISIYNFLIWICFRWFVERVHHHIIVRHSALEIPHLVHRVLLRLRILSQNLIIIMTGTSTCTSGSSLFTSTRSSCGYKRCSLCGYKRCSSWSGYSRPFSSSPCSGSTSWFVVVAWCTILSLYRWRSFRPAGMRGFRCVRSRSTTWNLYIYIYINYYYDLNNIFLQ